MTFYSPDNEGIQNDAEAIGYAQRHLPDGDPNGYEYDHCAWCGDEWPYTVAALLHIIQGGRTDEVIDAYQEMSEWDDSYADYE